MFGRKFHFHAGKLATDNAKTIDERRSKIVRNRVWDCHLSTGGGIKTLYLSIFDPRLSMVQNIFIAPYAVCI